MNGIDVRLHVVGCKNLPDKLPEFVINHGFLSKSNKDDFALLCELYLNSHFLIVPSLGECYGLVFCEACAFGLPSISHAVGGIPTIIKNGVNGLLFQLGTKPQSFVDNIIPLWKDRAMYQKMCDDARIEYDKRLNWNVAGKRITEILHEVINNK